jgi:hypothetical protein
MGRVLSDASRAEGVADVLDDERLRDHRDAPEAMSGRWRGVAAQMTEPYGRPAATVTRS